MHTVFWWQNLRVRDNLDDVGIGGWVIGLSKKMDGILNRYNLKSTGRIYTIGALKCSEKFNVLDLS